MPKGLKVLPKVLLSAPPKHLLNRPRRGSLARLGMPYLILAAMPDRISCYLHTGPPGRTNHPLGRTPRPPGLVCPGLGDCCLPTGTSGRADHRPGQDSLSPKTGVPGPWRLLPPWDGRRVLKGLRRGSCLQGPGTPAWGDEGSCPGGGRRVLKGPVGRQQSQKSPGPPVRGVGEPCPRGARYQGGAVRGRLCAAVRARRPGGCVAPLN